MSTENQKPSRRTFLATACLAATAAQMPPLNRAIAADPATTIKNTPQTILVDPALNLKFSEERMILPDGLQPSMLRTASGALVVQSQLSGKPHPSERIFYPYALATVISRDSGNTWLTFPLKPGDNGVNMEGGAIQ